MATEAEHPFVGALPPATDYLSYLTIVEANLDKAALPLLGQLLQDERLTTNIGWDLVHLLTPLLPESGDCLDAIARLGNPREVVLKVNEILEIIGYDAAAAADDATSEGGQTDDDGTRAENTAAREGAGEERRLRVLQFKYLLRMIGILHPRIKTKRPSRFLMTTAEAVIAAYKQLDIVALLEAGSQQSSNDSIDAGPARGSPYASWTVPIEEQSATDAVLILLANLSTVTRPPLPPRLGSASSILSQLTLAADPEAEAIDADEGALQRYMLISLATRVSETLNARLREGLSAQESSLTQRYTRERVPVPNVRHSETTTATGVETRNRSAQAALRKLETVLGSKLGVKADKLADLVLGPGRDGTSPAAFGDLAISDEGALLLWANSMFSGEAARDVEAAHHRIIVAKFLGGSSSIDFGPESLATIDAVLFLGWLAISRTDTADTRADGGGGWDQRRAHETAQGSYNEYLQQISVISANAPDSGLRYQSHLLVTNILRQTRDSGIKYGFIQDTLECCPFANLKVTAVGWLKDEILATAGSHRSADGKKTDQDMFGRPETLDNVAVSLFDADVDEEVGAIATHVPMWLAVLNLVYVVCVNKEISRTLGVAALVLKYDIERRFVDTLDAVSRSLLDDEQGDGPADMWSDASLLSDAVSRAREGIAKLDM